MEEGSGLHLEAPKKSQDERVMAWVFRRSNENATGKEEQDNLGSSIFSE